MSTLNGILNRGAGGLKLQTLATNTVAQNITGANSEGYARRQTALPGGQTYRVVDRFVERRVLNATSDRAEAEARAGITSTLDEVLAESDSGLGSTLDAFQASLRDFAAAPSDSAARQQVLARAEQLSGAFNRADQRLADAQSEANTRIADGVRQVNDLAAQIARLGGEISSVEVGGNEASDLRDQRDQRLRELSELVPISVIEGDRGSISVLLGGREALINTDNQARPLAAVRAPDGKVSVQGTSAGASIDVTGWLDTGSISGWVSARDQAIGDARTQLDQLAFDVGNAYNAVHSTGFGLDNGTGRNLFEVGTAATGAAARLSVSSDVRGQPSFLAAARDPALLPGDGRGAQSLIDVEGARVAAGGTASIGDSLANLILSGGIAAQNANRDLEARNDLEATAVAVRASISGVNSDEEMVALMNYQRAYQASLKVVQTADEMLQELLQIKR